MIRRPALILSTLVLAACAGGGGDFTAGEPREAGTNLVGEACTVTSAAAAVGGGQSRYNILCGSWEQPSARVTGQAGGGDAAVALANGPWRDEVNSRMQCEAPQAATFAGDLPGLMMQCRLLKGGFPTVAMAIAADGELFLADGIPAALPVIERTVLAALGRAPLGGETAESRAIALVRQATGRPLTGANAIDAYYGAMASAQYHDTIQSFAASEDDYRRAMLVQAEAIGSEDPSTADPLMHVALELSNQGRYDEAAPLFDEAQRLAASSINPGDTPRLLSYRAIDAANQGKLDLALRFAEKATAERRRLAEREGGLAPGAALGASFTEGSDLISYGGVSAALLAVDVAQSLHTQAALHLRQGNFDEAARTADEAIAIARVNRAAPPWWLPQFLETRSTIARAQGNLGSAAALQGEAVRIWTSILPQSVPEGLSRLGLGRSLYANGDARGAIDSYRQGFAILKARNAEIRPRELLGFLDVAQAVSEADPAQRDQLAVEMFEAMQLMRSGVTSRTVSLATARLASGDQAVGAVIRAQQENERKRYSLVASLNRALSAPADLRDTKLISDLRERLATVEAEGRSLDEQVQAASSGYRQLLATPVTGADLQALLKPDEAMVAFAAAETGAYGFLVRSDRIRVWKIAANDQALGDAVIVLRRAMIPSKEGRLPRFPVDSAHGLYSLLFGPATADLEDVKTLVTSANGPLASIPMGILVRDPAGRAAGGDYRQVDWLVRHHALAMVPSVRAFADLRRVGSHSAATQAMIGFGDYRPAADPASLYASLPPACARDRKVLASLGALPATAGELRNVAGLVGGGADALKLGTGFTKSAITGQPLSDYRIVYFATHAVLASEIRCFAEPALLVSPTPGGGADSALLKLSDILDLRLDADLVVLSACNTGGTDGKNGGEALSGLARAFFYAGARRLVVSHWPVPDASTAALMSRLFKPVDAGTGGAAALRQAQLEVIGGAGPVEWSHPLFWAGFSAVGDGTGVIR